MNQLSVNIAVGISLLLMTGIIIANQFLLELVDVQVTTLSFVLGENEA